MKSLYLIRHAKSSWENPTLKDFDRPLNPRGQRDAPFMAKLLKGKCPELDLIVSSPAKRAYTTASIFADAYHIPLDAIQLEKKIYDAYPEDILEIVNELPKNVKTVLVFGHNPTFTTLANLFSDDYLSNLPTCGIVRIDAEIEDWAAFGVASAKMTEFHYPKQYFS
ncbi:MAG: histidine phosphatase family protein [Saprospiraceae bacterium]|nr:histidine phosphatase family protein [Saprospiraceae bacterium]